MTLSYHKRIITLLSDSKWRTLREIHQAVARFINTSSADKEYRKRHTKWQKDKITDRVAQGKKRLVFLSLNSAIHHGKTVEARGHDWDREYRLTKKALMARTGPSESEKKKRDSKQSKERS